VAIISVMHRVNWPVTRRFTNFIFFGSETFDALKIVTGFCDDKIKEG
jgi:hypothetical protein